MKLNLFKALLFTGILMAGSLAVHAESFKLDVPFPFSAGSMALPAGGYSVEVSGNVICLRGASESVMLMAIPATSAASKTSAIFDSGAAGASLMSVTVANGMTYAVTAPRHSALSLASPAEGAVLSKRK